MVRPPYEELPLLVLERLADLGDERAAEIVISLGPGPALRDGWEQVAARYASGNQRSPF